MPNTVFWFTPGGEIDLCGHATLATAYVITRFYEPGQTQVVFETLSGTLTVTKKDDLFEMAFPVYNLTPIPVTQAMSDAIGAEPAEAYMGRDLLCVFDDEEIVRHIQPDQSKVKELNGLLLHVTAYGYEIIETSTGGSQELFCEPPVLPKSQFRTLHFPVPILLFILSRNNCFSRSVTP